VDNRSLQVRIGDGAAERSGPQNLDLRTMPQDIHQDFQQMAANQLHNSITLGWWSELLTDKRR